MIDEFLHEPRIAYFTMEIALHNNIPTYSGGLGVLAGDTIRSGADMNLPLVAVSLVSRAGYFKQEIDFHGRQVEHASWWKPEDQTEPLEAKIAVRIESREVWVRGWLFIQKSHIGGKEPVILLDTNLDENLTEDREITHYLYGGDERYRLKQEIVLGIGGVRMLQALGFEIRTYHMNEGHSALLTLELLRRYTYADMDIRPGESLYDIPRIRDLCVFTTHTPVEAGHDRFPYDLVERILGNFIDLAELKALAGNDCLNMTRLALNLSDYVNGVAKRHAQLSRNIFPGYRVHAITNGVHPHTWTCSSFARLYDTHIPGWCHEPELLVRIDQVSNTAIWDAHGCAKRHLIERVQSFCKIGMDPDVLILGFARRMTAYKRPDMLFSNLERLREIARHQPFQLVLAGKAHPRDEQGKRLIETLHAQLRKLEGVIKITFIPDYNLEVALDMVSGVDVWLNTPQRPLEASGTSGMKAAFNGVPSLSVLDGWWIEGCIEGVTGWSIGDTAESANGNDANSLYEKLEKRVLPLYYGDRSDWVAVMKGAIGKNASFFNSHRMIRRYTTEAYI